MELVVLWLLCGVVAAVIAARKGSAGVGLVLGFFLGPFGIIIAAVMKGDRRECPQCREWIHREATICPKCRSSLEPQTEPTVAPRSEANPARDEESGPTFGQRLGW